MPPVRCLLPEGDDKDLTKSSILVKARVSTWVHRHSSKADVTACCHVIILGGPAGATSCIICPNGTFSAAPNGTYVPFGEF